jgi:hypothetical protein
LLAVDRDFFFFDPRVLVDLELFMDGRPFFNILCGVTGPDSLSDHGDPRSLISVIL